MSRSGCCGRRLLRFVLIGCTLVFAFHALLEDCVAQAPGKRPISSTGVKPLAPEELTTLEGRGCSWQPDLSAYKCIKNREEDFNSYEWFRPDLKDFARQVNNLLRVLPRGPGAYTVIVQGFADCVFRPLRKRRWESLEDYVPGGEAAVKGFARCGRRSAGDILNEDVAFLRSCLTALLLREELRGETQVIELSPVAYGDPGHCGGKHRAVEVYLRPKRGGL